MADAFFEVAIAADNERVVVADLGPEAGAQHTLGHTESDGVGEALTEGAGGDLDAGGVMHLGVTRRAALPLTELLEVLDGEAVTGEEEHGVLQDAGVAGGQDEPITVRPHRV